MTSKTKSKSRTLVNQSFSLFTSCCYYITDTDNLEQKSVVVVTEESDHGNIDQSPAIAASLSIHKFERYINERGECSISFFKTTADQEPFHTQWYCKTGIVCGHDESNKSDNECSKCGEYYQEDGSEWLQYPVYKKCCFHETCFYE